MVIILGKLEWWYEVFYLLFKEYLFYRFKFLKLKIYLMENSITHAFCYLFLFLFFIFLAKLSCLLLEDDDIRYKS